MERAGRKDEEKYLIPTRIGDMDKFDDENMHRYLNFGHDSVKHWEKKPELVSHVEGVQVATLQVASVCTVLQQEVGSQV